ncbi:MAG TPA: N-acetyl-gamma-glutamyl-phosphate reductase [Actinomycetes bacterium]|nr:N-acetyl-gamma-glutamyl-phosphate reductase [Actinomycetes bacterium]
MGMRAAVAGASGYAGGELLRLLATHPELEIGPICAASHAGARIGDVHPHLTSLADEVLLATDADALADVDLAFLALPHGQSAALARQLPDDAVIVDLGADHRLRDADAWRTYYGGDHAGTWTYGLPELPSARDVMRGARRVANPGCYATAVALGLAPLLAAAVVQPDDIVVVAASGTSGAGRSATTSLLATEVMGSLSAYKVGGTHQHIPEMEQTLSIAAGASASSAVTLSFTPILAPMPRGILATCTARLSGDVDTDDLRTVMADVYADEPFVHTLAEGRWPSTAATLGSNSAHVQVAADRHAGRAVVVVALDNLGKGAAGQAIQNANLALGLPETVGLPVHGVAP